MGAGSACLNLSVFRVALGRGSVRGLDWMPAHGYVILKRRSLPQRTRGFTVNSSPRNQPSAAAWLLGCSPSASTRQLNAQAAELGASELSTTELAENLEIRESAAHARHSFEWLPATRSRAHRHASQQDSAAMAPSWRASGDSIRLRPFLSLGLGLPRHIASSHVATTMLRHRCRPSRAGQSEADPAWAPSFAALNLAAWVRPPDARRERAIWRALRRAFLKIRRHDGSSTGPSVCLPACLPAAAPP
ncbi:hypothetical protein PHYSODRAFT_327937 [Phytophthora sojae]|uniref:Uncharacterized protein n=1 Tax=Phytophthora sojae (strain P6497) TaxID=1094619 RepID=G4Z8X6_PHYSP|nr:hypothetical protein PHYSODRAFT_327937 [Phytophthora sojae]EGZ19747.1 hypothetical protein PHYSODRAFT_327937 [Phytophthora sojae]|eukprot:XP_009522464.1 hypothetical protein PHYSODRAFT_327937 [Phytophthora sojae]